MIKKLLNLSALVFCLAAGSAVAELKIAAIDMQRALIEGEEAMSIQKQILEDSQSEEASVKTLLEEIRALSERLQKDGEVMSPTEQLKAQKEIENKQIDYQFMGNKLRKAHQDRIQELASHMQPKVNAVIRDLIELEGYDLIIDARNAIYVNPKHNITRKVLEKLNEKR